MCPACGKLYGGIHNAPHRGSSSSSKKPPTPKCSFPDVVTIMPKVPPPSIPAQIKPETEQFLKEGDERYSQNDFSGAVEAYTQALAIQSKSGVVYASRAQAYLSWAQSLDMQIPEAEISASPGPEDEEREGNNERRAALKAEALKDAQRATDFEPMWATSWTRVAEALKALLLEETLDANQDEVKQMKVLNGIRAALENAILFTKANVKSSDSRSPG
ncbi:hypothetical protein GYMLUDRAFT_47109 [Collybiopsis luxurians FD-317 M1]|uniref:Uncharacterized protein n=1 Tax=Collybiopsis luxurians FD-317 M1 TaxID=944289 RepID=A0A0D0B002_9AGAR|nr:hypothetical protein GYMLUDRAFT_47109 [Collybiopsis luxurians FD-317 M1]